MVVERAEDTFYTDSWQSLSIEAFNKYCIRWKIGFSISNDKIHSFFSINPSQEWNRPPPYSTRKIISSKNLLEANFLDPFINGVGSESLFDSAPVIPLLLVNNNGIIPS